MLIIQTTLYAVLYATTNATPPAKCSSKSIVHLIISQVVYAFKIVLHLIPMVMASELLAVISAVYGVLEVDTFA